MRLPELAAKLAPFIKPRFVPLATSLTSTSWDGDARSTAAKALVDLSAVFGVPAGIKAALFYVQLRDSGSAANDCLLVLSNVDTADVGQAVACSGLANDAIARQTLIVPCDANGDVYAQTYASGSGTLDVWLRIVGYWY